MSRAKPLENSAAVSLFPFLAVLLCTMGALVVVLVAMSRTARETALRQSASTAEPAVEAAAVDDAKLEQLKQYAELLAEMRAKSQENMRDDQQRLTHLEAHMRQLQDELRQLAIAAAELDSLDEEHYDDREQAEREVARLHRLIANTRQSIEELKAEQTDKKRSFALVPYEGPNGTLRRPIFIECRDDAIVLQPEGVQLSEHDLRPPLGAGNALASALRAARSHYIRLNPAEGRHRDAEPYPLIIVRPSGAGMFGTVQKAIQSADLDFGYELVEEDWELKYPAADPQLALAEQQAIDQARIRQEALAAAAPRAYGDPAYAIAGRFDTQSRGMPGYGYPGFSTGPIGSGALEIGPYASAEGGDGLHEGGSAGEDASGNSSAPSWDGTSATGTPTASLDGEMRPTTEGVSQSSQTPVPGTPAQPQMNASHNNQFGVGTWKNHTDPWQSTGFSTEQMPGMEAGASNVSLQFSPGQNSNAPANAEPQTGSPQKQFDPETFKKMEADWRRKHPRAVPIQRNIDVLVHNDQLAVLSSDSGRSQHIRPGKSIPLSGDTVLSMDEFVSAVREEVSSWGIAGADLYWRPALVLRVAPGGERRAGDLQRLLTDSGIQVRVADAPGAPVQGVPSATRR